MFFSCMVLYQRLLGGSLSLAPIYPKTFQSKIVFTTLHITANLNIFLDYFGAFADNSYEREETNELRELYLHFYYATWSQMTLNILCGKQIQGKKSLSFLQPKNMVQNVKITASFTHDLKKNYFTISANLIFIQIIITLFSLILPLALSLQHCFFLSPLISF